MTWLRRIFFSGIWLLPAFAGSVSGTVRLVESLDPAVRKHQDYAGVVVWLEPVASRVAAAAAVKPATVKMVQKDKRFLPHVLAIPVGSSVAFPNYDPIFHNAFSSFSGEIFDVGLYPPGTSRTVTFRRSGLVRVFCNIHPLMSAVIVVLDTPWFSVTGPSGAYHIENVAPGDYRLHLFHERATESTLKSLQRLVTLTADNLALPAISISEAGYVQTPHKNKHGEDYPPVPDDHVLYPGARK